MSQPYLLDLQALAELVPVQPATPARAYFAQKTSWQTDELMIINASRPILLNIGGKTYRLAAGRHGFPYMLTFYNNPVLVAATDFEAAKIELVTFDQLEELGLLGSLLDLQVLKHLFKYPLCLGGLSSPTTSDPIFAIHGLVGPVSEASSVLKPVLSQDRQVIEQYLNRGLVKVLTLIV
jgi:hypothetical protein